MSPAYGVFAFQRDHHETRECRTLDAARDLLHRIRTSGGDASALLMIRDTNGHWRPVTGRR